MTKKKAKTATKPVVAETEIPKKKYPSQYIAKKILKAMADLPLLESIVSTKQARDQKCIELAKRLPRLRLILNGGSHLTADPSQSFQSAAPGKSPENHDWQKGSHIDSLPKQNEQITFTFDMLFVSGEYVDIPEKRLYKEYNLPNIYPNTIKQKPKVLVCLCPQSTQGSDYSASVAAIDFILEKGNEAYVVFWSVYDKKVTIDGQITARQLKENFRGKTPLINQNEGPMDSPRSPYFWCNKNGDVRQERQEQSRYRQEDLI